MQVPGRAGALVSGIMSYCELGYKDPRWLS